MLLILLYFKVNIWMHDGVRKTDQKSSKRLQTNVIQAQMCRKTPSQRLVCLYN